MTKGEFVSRVINGLGALTRDQHISKRYILRIGENKAKFYISQKLNDKSLFKEQNLFKTIECFRLKEENRITCGIASFMRCDSLMKSKKKIPALVFSRLGSSIISITSIDGKTLFHPISPVSYEIMKSRKGASKFNRTYYYIQDGYLYLLDSEVQLVKITYIPYDESEVDEASDCDDCDDSKGNDESGGCKSAWDYTFSVPDKLSEQVIQETIQEVSMRIRIPMDEYPDGDSNVKTNMRRDA